MTLILGILNRFPTITPWICGCLASSRAALRPMILSSVLTKNTQNCVYLSYFLRLSFVFFFVFVPFGVRIRCTSLRRLEVVDRLDSANDLCGRLDVLDDLVHAFISHRRLVKSLGNDAGGVYTRHLCLVLCHGESLKCGGT